MRPLKRIKITRSKERLSNRIGLPIIEYTALLKYETQMMYRKWKNFLDAVTNLIAEYLIELNESKLDDLYEKR